MLLDDDVATKFFFKKLFIIFNGVILKNSSILRMNFVASHTINRLIFIKYL